MKSAEVFDGVVKEWLKRLDEEAMPFDQVESLVDIWDKTASDRVVSSEGAGQILDLAMHLYSASYEHETEDEDDWQVHLLLMMKLAAAVEILTERRFIKIAK